MAASKPTILMDADNLELWGDVQDAAAERWDDAGRTAAALAAPPAVPPSAAASAAAAPPPPAPLPPLTLAKSFPWLAHAAEAGSADEIKRLFNLFQPALAALGAEERRLVLNAPAGSGKDALPPLFMAAKHGNVAAVLALGELGVPFLDEVHPATGLTALATAVREGQSECVRALLAIGCDPNARLGENHPESPGGTALHAAFSVIDRWEFSDAGNAERKRRYAAAEAALEALLSSGGRSIVNVEATDSKGRTALALALRQGRAAAARTLLKHGADAAALNRWGASTLTWLALGPRDDAELARLLLAGGARAHPGFDSDGRSPVFVAAGEGHLEVLRVLLESPDGEAAARAVSPSGDTALHRALPDEYYLRDRVKPEIKAEMARLLLAKGADPTVRDFDGRVPAFGAVASGSVPLLRVLLDEARPRTDPSSADSKGQTLLTYSMCCRSFECTLMLIERGADVRPTIRRPEQHYYYVQPVPAETAADVLLQHVDRYGFLQVSEIVFARVMSALLRNSAPFDRARYGWLLMRHMPAILREAGDAAGELARRRTPRQRTLGQEDIVNLAFDFLDLRAAEEGVRRREERVRELERQLEEAGIGADETTATTATTGEEEEEDGDEEEKEVGTAMEEE